MNFLSISFFQRPTQEVAQELLGKILISTIENKLVSGIITETEAYGDHSDAASHAASGTITSRNQFMFGPIGHTYVYQCYGMHRCLNIVARAANTKAGAVLIRSIEPIKGISTIKQRRSITQEHMLTNGPGKVAQALGITLAHNGINVMQDGPLSVIDSNNITRIDSIKATPRIGISRNKDILWRFIATIQYH